MKESEWPYAIAHSYEFMGKTHHMRIDEARLFDEQAADELSELESTEAE